MIPPSSLAISQGWGLIDLPLRASNEGSLRPRVARAQKIIRLHPLLQPPQVPADRYKQCSVPLPCGFLSPPPRIGYAARLPCPSCSVLSVASLCHAPSRTTLAHSKATAWSGTSRVPAGVSPVICPCDQGKPSRSLSHSRMSNG